MGLRMKKTAKTSGDVRSSLSYGTILDAIRNTQHEPNSIIFPAQSPVISNCPRPKSKGQLQFITSSVKTMLYARFVQSHFKKIYLRVGGQFSSPISCNHLKIRRIRQVQSRCPPTMTLDSRIATAGGVLNQFWRFFYAKWRCEAGSPNLVCRCPNRTPF
jgi:hypothetical protein